MRETLRRVVMLAGIGAALAGCSIDTFTSTIERYGTVKARQVHLGCHDTYEVYDRPDAGTILVLTNGVNEALAGLCADGSAAPARPERMRRVARLFLEETSDRPQCGVVRETPVSEWQTEYGYRCPALPALRRRVELRR